MSCAPRRRAEEIDHLLDDLGQVGRLQLQVLDAGEAQEVVGDVDQALTFALQALDALQGPAFALRSAAPAKSSASSCRLRPERAEVVLDLVDEAARQLGQLGVLFV